MPTTGRRHSTRSGRGARRRRGSIPPEAARLRAGARAGRFAPEVGVSRVSWYTTRNGARVYPQTSFLLPEWRKPGVWPELVREGDRRIRAMAAGHPSLPERSFQGWATESQTQWIDALEAEGYEAVRHFRNMVRPLESVPDPEGGTPPEGLEVRPVAADHMRRIWEGRGGSESGVVRGRRRAVG